MASMGRSKQSIPPHELVVFIVLQDCLVLYPVHLATDAIAANNVLEMVGHILVSQNLLANLQ